MTDIHYQPFDSAGNKYGEEKPVKLTCKTCGADVATEQHRPSLLDPDGIGNSGHRVNATPDAPADARPDIDNFAKAVVAEYGETLKMLGDERAGAHGRRDPGQVVPCESCKRGVSARYVAMGDGLDNRYLCYECHPEPLTEMLTGELEKEFDRILLAQGSDVWAGEGPHTTSYYSGDFKRIKAELATLIAQREEAAEDRATDAFHKMIPMYEQAAVRKFALEVRAAVAEESCWKHSPDDDYLMLHHQQVYDALNWALEQRGIENTEPLEDAA